MLYDDYESYLIRYKKEYGENTLVLMQCGSFYELYDDGSKQTDLRMIGELLNIQVSRRNKSILEVSRNNLEMAGFPAYTLSKFLNILVANNFTTVIVSQTTPPPNPKREVTDIVSPGTYIENDVTTYGSESNYLMSIFVEEFCEYKTNKLSIVVGAALVDLGTGKTYCFECASRSNDIHHPLDELYRIIVAYNPREVIICGKLKMTDAVSMVTFDKIVRYLDLDGKCVHNDYEKYASMCSELEKPSYQEELLTKVYGSSGILSKVDFLGLERMPSGLLSFIRLLQFVHGHNENILKKVQKPQVLEASSALVLSYNSVKQLDIVQRETSTKLGARSGGASSLLNLLNNCKTAIGRRYFKERLLSPSNNTCQLQESYENIEIFLTSHQSRKLLDTLYTHMVDIYDVERLFRKIDLGTIQPFEIGYIVVSLKNIQKVIDEVKTLNLQMTQLDLAEVQRCIGEVLEVIESTLSEDELLKYNLDNISPLVFAKGHSPRLDEMFEEMNASKEYVYDIASQLNKLYAQGGGDAFKVENNERDGFHLLITSKRFADFKKMNSHQTITTLLKTMVSIEELESKAVSHSSSNVKVTHTSFRSINEKIESLGAKVKRLCIDEYKKVLMELSNTTSQYAQIITYTIALIDFYWCCASNAHRKKYNKPCISTNGKVKSFLKAKGLRHPIIESLNDNIAYVSNDVTLGVEGCDGVLLYGLNSSGKSSLMKSIGIAVLMAQAGMYVACDSLEYCPYDYIFTRIFSSDDIFKGQSTFTKEMMELRGILRRADEKSLVLGDELCSGTESISALSIVSAGIHTLAQRESSFIFATHLHDLVTIPLVKKLDNVKTFHLSVEYDEVQRTLVYDRKLKEGNGSSLYGLEVCKSLDLEQDFLEIANTVRQGILNISRNIVSEQSNSNKYNKGVYMDECQVCGQKASEVHHINEQKDADKDGYIEGKFHKNSKFNLVCLCEECHNNVHHGQLIINGYKQTSKGVVLDFSTQQPRQASNNNADTSTQAVAVRNVIAELLRDNTKVKRKDILLFVRQRMPTVEISQYKIDKIVKEVKGMQE